jgi:hypothetical protein
MAPPDLLVRPALDRDFGVEEFGRIDEALEAGERAMHEALDRFSFASDGGGEAGVST